MASHILKCPNCMQYTMKSICVNCNVQTSAIKPLKYSPEDQYGDYRRQAKRSGLVARGLL